MRKLATVREIRSIDPILGADRIELARVDGWQVVVRKDEFKVGDWAVYFEIDSFLPMEPEYEFLRKSSLRTLPEGREGFRLRTVKLRKTLSQGLLIPINIIEEKLHFHGIPLDTDLTESLNVIKWEPPIPAQLQGQQCGLRPSFVPKTDEERIQNYMDWFQSEKHTKFEISEKIDGSSMSIYSCDDEFGVTSRKMDLKLDQTGNSFVDVAHRSGLIELIKAADFSLVLQGELCGPGIQKNTLGLSRCEFFIYNVWRIDKARYMVPEERLEFLSELGMTGHDYGITHEPIKHVPILDLHEYRYPFLHSLEDLLALAIRPSAIDTAVKPAEGLVFKSVDTVHEVVRSFKIINNQRLMDLDTDE